MCVYIYIYIYVCVYIYIYIYIYICVISSFGDKQSMEFGFEQNNETLRL